MTTHKDSTHDERCRGDFPLYGCTCDVGTRWYGNGHRRDDAIAIQGIATFFARLQPAVSAQQRFRHPQKTMPDWSPWQQCGVSARQPWAIDSVGYEVEYQPLYASPVTPAAHVVDVADICNAYESGVGHRGRRTASINPYAAGTHEHEAYAIGASGKQAAQTVAVLSAPACTCGTKEPDHHWDDCGVFSQTVAVPDEHMQTLREIAECGFVDSRRRLAMAKAILPILSTPATPAKVDDDVARPIAWLNPDNLLSISDYAKQMGCKGSTYPKFSIPCSSFEELCQKRAMLSAAQAQKKEAP